MGQGTDRPMATLGSLLFTYARNGYNNERKAMKQAIESGTGCGLTRFGMALLRFNVVAIDQIEVPLILMRNVK